MDREAPVAAETLLARLLRPLMLETGSVKGIVPPFGACCLVSDDVQNEAWSQMTALMKKGG